jgi:hypothetical protein
LASIFTLVTARFMVFRPMEFTKIVSTKGIVYR